MLKTFIIFLIFGFIFAPFFFNHLADSRYDFPEINPYNRLAENFQI